MRYITKKLSAILMMLAIVVSIFAVNTQEVEAADSTFGIKCNFYYSDGYAWRKVNTSEIEFTSTILTSPENGKRTFAASASELEKVYGQFGFKASDLTAGNNMFRHAVVGDENAWADRAPIVSGGQTYVQLLTTDSLQGNITNYLTKYSNIALTVCDIYYMPADAANTAASISVNDTDLISRNALVGYTEEEMENISATANINFFYSDGSNWNLVNGQTMQVPVVLVPVPGTNAKTYAIDAKTLASIYGQFGFNASSLTAENNAFRHTTMGGADAWGDRRPFMYADTMFVQLLKPEDGLDMDVYFMPAYATNYDDTVAIYGRPLRRMMAIKKNAVSVLPELEKVVLENVNFYVSDGTQWLNVARGAEVVKIEYEGQMTYAISTDTLQQAYSFMGFEGIWDEVVTGYPSAIRHAVAGNNLAWADRGPLEYAGKVYVQVLQPVNGDAMDIYLTLEESYNADARNKAYIDITDPNEIAANGLIF